MKKLNDLKNDMRVYPIYTYSLLHSFNFILQSAFLYYIDLLATRQKRQVRKNFKQHIMEALSKINVLLMQDAQNISQGLYPAEVLRPENMRLHAKRLPFVGRRTKKIDLARGLFAAETR